MIYRKLFDSRIDELRSSFKASAAVDHGGVKGGVREVFVKKLLSGLLHPDFEVGSGICVDRMGNQSPQCDVVIYDRSVVPTLFMEEQPFIPIDSVADIIEVKSSLTNEEIADCIKKAAKLYELTTVGYFFRLHIFAFSSPVDSGVSLIKRIREIADTLGVSPNLFRQVACLDREYICKIGDESSGTQGIMNSASCEVPNDYVAAFVSGLINHIYDLKGPVKISPGYFIFGNHDFE